MGASYLFDLNISPTFCMYRKLKDIVTVNKFIGHLGQPRFA